jgi:hypothetical protein
VPPSPPSSIKCLFADKSLTALIHLQNSYFCPIVFETGEVNFPTDLHKV